MNLTDLIPTKFSIEKEFLEHVINPVSFDKMRSPFYSGERWAVRQGPFCLSTDGEWEHEPMPSSRDKEFYDRCRFATIAEALQAYNSTQMRE